MHDAIVIGGGVLGAATAWHLVHARARVLLLDRGDEGRATSAGAGIVSPATYRGDSDVWYRFSRASYRHLSTLVPQLEAEGIGTGFARCGLLLVAVSEDEFGPFEAASQRILSRPDEGSPVRPVDTAEAREMFPPLAESARALHNPDAARIDGRLLAPRPAQGRRTSRTRAPDRLGRQPESRREPRHRRPQRRRPHIRGVRGHRRRRLVPPLL